MIKIRNKLQSKAENLKFFQEEHEYNLQGRKLVSVTQLISKYYPPFDPKGILTAKCAVKNGITPREQAEIWEKQGKASADRGTDIHKIAEDIMLNKEYFHHNKDHHELVNTLCQIKAQIKDNILATEQLIYSEEHMIAGTVDLMLSDGETIDIYDYKTNKKPIVPNIYYGKMLSPIDDIPANDYYKYALQLSLYRYILEQDGFKVNRLCLIHLNDSPQIIELPYMKEVIMRMLLNFKYSTNQGGKNNEAHIINTGTKNQHLHRKMPKMRRNQKST